MMDRETSDQALDAALKELIMKARHGDSVAYKNFLVQISPVIRRAVAMRIVRSGQKSYVEDITQDVLLAVHLKLCTYDAQQLFLPWLRTVTKYKTIDFFRQSGRAHISSLDDGHAEEPADIASEHDITADRDLDKILKQLKPPAGEIIHALKVEGVSVRDLAAQYKTSEGNIKVIVHRGLQKLSQLVQTERRAS